MAAGKKGERQGSGGWGSMGVGDDGGKEKGKEEREWRWEKRGKMEGSSG